jgi:predicted component of type VI protein secretion system
MKIIDATKVLVVAAAVVAAAACTRDSGGPASSGAQGESATSSPSTAAPVAVPGPAMAVKTPVEAPVLNEASAPLAPTPQIEWPAPPAAPAAMQAMTTTQATLDGLATAVAGTRVRFVDCGASASCTARLEGQSLAGLRDLLQSVSQQQGGVDFTAREQLDGFAGRTFVADVTLGAATARAVPADENALLTN